MMMMRNNVTRNVTNETQNTKTTKNFIYIHKESSGGYGGRTSNTVCVCVYTGMTRQYHQAREKEENNCFTYLWGNFRLRETNGAFKMACRHPVCLHDLGVCVCLSVLRRRGAVGEKERTRTEIQNKTKSVVLLTSTTDFYCYIQCARVCRILTV